jgi:hypothetical protein
MTHCSSKSQSHTPVAVKNVSARKKIVEIFVGPGQFTDPSYRFFDSEGDVLENFKVNPKKKYRFSRLDGATSHPFYISDRGYNQKASSGLRIKGDGTFGQGVVGDQSFTVSFKKKARRSLKRNGGLFFYCTSHSSMFDEFVIKSKKSNRKISVDSLPNEDGGFVSSVLTGSSYARIDSSSLSPVDSESLIVSADQVSA